MDADSNTGFSTELDKHRGKYPARTDQAWADNAQRVHDFIVEHARMPRKEDEPRDLATWVRTQRRRIGSSAGSQNVARNAKKAERDADRVGVLNAMPGWSWGSEGPSCACSQRLVQLEAFTREHHRRPVGSRRARRRDSLEANLARWLDMTERTLREAARGEEAQTLPVGGSARWKLRLLYDFSGGLAGDFLD